MPEEQMEEEPPQPVQQHPTDDGIILIDSQGCFVRRRGRATCETVKNLPPGTRINIEVNDSGIPCNFPESTLLASYLGMLVKDPVLAPISFEDWRKPGMKRYKMLLCADVESKFAYNSQVRQWVLKSLGVKWRNFKTALKAAYWDGRSIQEVIEGVPEGIDALQWATLVSTWDDPRNKARAEQNTQNAQKQKCPHTMGRKSTVQRQQDTSTKDRLQLWRLNRLHKDGSWTSEDAKEKWELACQRLAESDLTPDDGNVEENEKVFLEVMGPEHSGRVRCGGFGVTPSNYYPQTSSSTGCSSTGASSYARSDERLTRVETDVVGLKGTVNQIQGTVDEMYAFIREQANKEKDL